MPLPSGSAARKLFEDSIITQTVDRENDFHTAIFILAYVNSFIQPAEGHGPAEPTSSQEASSQRATSNRSRIRCNKLLASPDVFFFDLFRMNKAVFFDLCRWLRNNTGIKGSRQQSLECKLMVFLWICAFDAPQRNAGAYFFLSQSSVSRTFHELIGPMRHLHIKFVQLPKPRYLSLKVEFNRKFESFNGAIGAIDGTHIPAYIPIKNQQRFWSRKNNISQNVLAAVTFDGLFSYVLAGAEGSINDAALLPQAMTRSFKIPAGRYYLADAGFGSRKGIVIPYPRVRYHLNDWGDVDRRPQDHKELFNYRHAQLRTVVERVFGKCKRKFKIIRHSAPEYSFADQIQIVYAVTGLYNFILLAGQPLKEYYNEEEDNLTRNEQRILSCARDRADNILTPLTGLQTRDYVAQETWRSYEAYLRAPGGNSGSEDNSSDDSGSEVSGFDENSGGNDENQHIREVEEALNNEDS